MVTAPVVFYDLREDHALAARLAGRRNAAYGRLERRRFPDGESYVRLAGPIEGHSVVLCGSLADPDAHFLALAFAARTARDLGARSVVLAAPYFAYMRQDVRFNAGEPISARYFCELLATLVDGVVTVDPHLHRIHALADVLPVPSRTVQAAPALAEWIRRNVQRPVVVGPDAESRQWVEAVAAAGGFDFVVLEKERRGDRDVSVSALTGRLGDEVTPVVVDDIAASGRTLAAGVESCLVAGTRPPVCAVVHALCDEADLAEVRAAGAARVVATNTTPHALAEIDVTPLIGAGVDALLADMQA